MKYPFIFLFAIVFAFSLNCGDNPSAPDEENTEFEVQLKALETELEAVTLEDPGDSRDENNSKVVRLRKMIGRIDKLIDRLIRFERRHTDEDANKLIRQAYRHKNAAITSFKDREFRKAFRHAQEARSLARRAMKILRSKYGKNRG